MNQLASKVIRNDVDEKVGRNPNHSELKKSAETTISNSDRDSSALPMGGSLLSHRGDATCVSSSLTSDGRRKWKKPKDKPKRPLSAYNLFFQYEREKIVSGSDNNDYGHRSIPLLIMDLEKIAVRNKKFGSNGNEIKRRKHCKSHGKIGFADMGRTIAKKWRALDKTTRAIFQQRAGLEKSRYMTELEKWNMKQKEKKLGIMTGFESLTNESGSDSLGNQTNSLNTHVRFPVYINRLHNFTSVKSEPHKNPYQQLNWHGGALLDGQDTFPYYTYSNSFQCCISGSHQEGTYGSSKQIGTQYINGNYYNCHHHQNDGTTATPADAQNNCREAPLWDLRRFEQTPHSDEDVAHDRILNAIPFHLEESTDDSPMVTFSGFGDCNGAEEKSILSNVSETVCPDINPDNFFRF